MAVGTGYSKVATTGLVFAYDTADTYNSYKGEPTTNYWNGNQFSIYNDGATNIRNSTDVAPPVPGYEVVKVTANTLGVNGQCILWNATYPNNNVATITNSIYAYLIAGDYVSVGQHWWPWYYGTQKAIAKNQWVRISETYTINEGNSYGNAALTYSTNGIAYFAMPQFEYVSHVTPFIGANQTRSNTQGLLDISGRGSTVTLDNMSYDANAQFYFDGSDDYISLNTLTPSPTGLTMSVVARINSASSSWVRFFDFGNGQNNDNLLFCRYGSSNNLFFGVYNGSTNNFTFGGTLQFDQLAMYTATADGTNFRIYVNGQLAHTAANGTVPSTTTRTSNYLGKSNWPDPYLNGQIPVAQIYNRALSAAEIRDNYFHYKTRFGLP